MDSLKKRSWITIAVVAIATALFGALIPGIVLDNEVKIYFPSDHQSYVNMENLNDTYGSQIFLVVAVSNPDGSVVHPKAIASISDLTAQFEALEGVVSVKSMTNVDYLTGGEAGMTSERLVPDSYDGSPAALASVTARIVDWKSMYDRVIVSDDMASSEIVITVDHEISAPAMSDLNRKVRAIVDGKKGDGLEYRVAGDPVLSQMAQDFMKSDLSRLIPAVSLVVVLCLYFSFRTLVGTLLPLITVLVSTIWTVGLMALTGTHFTVVSSCLPVLLIAVGSAYGIHVVNHYYEDLAHDFSGMTIGKEQHAALIKASIKKVRTPVLLSGITTILGFASTISSPITPLKGFAVFSSVGVAIALVLSLTLIPALLAVKPIGKNGLAVKKESSRKADAPAGLGKRAAAKVNNFLFDRTLSVAVIVVAVLLVSLWGLSRIEVESALLEYFPKECQLRRDVEYIDDRFAGSNLMSVVVSGPEKGDLTDPEILAAMDGLTDYLKARHPEIGKTISYSDFIRRMNKVMNVPTADGADGIDAAAASGGETSAGSDEGFSDSFFSFEDESSDAASPADPALPAADVASSGAVLASFPDLSEKVALAEALDLFRAAYVAAGPRPTVDRMMAELEKAANYRGAAYDEIPRDVSKYPVADSGEFRNLISQYLMLYSGSLDEFSNDQLQPSAARISVQLRTHETSKVESVIADVADYAARNFPEGYKAECAGIAEMEVALTAMITDSQVVSLLLAIACVFVVLAVAFKSPTAGFIGAVPLTLSILINFGIMGLAGINLDMVTSLVSSIAIGIGVDYTIHFMSNYKHERLLSDDLRSVTLNTFMVSGKAILVNAAAVALGFLVLAFSEFVVLRYIGILVAVVMATSSLTAMTVLPVMLNLIKPKFISRKEA